MSTSPEPIDLWIVFLEPGQAEDYVLLSETLVTPNEVHLE
jgi:hypothetical protein